MSSCRDVGQDRATTLAALGGQRLPDENGRNWLGHEVNSGAAEIDELLLTGATLQQMSAARETAREHIRHLREEHGLPIVECGELYRFDQQALQNG